MEARVRHAVMRGSGLITTADVRRLGVDDQTIARWVRCQLLLTVRRGVFTTPEHWAALGEYDGRPLLRVRAARLSMRHRHVLSHDSSALAQRLPLIDPATSLIHFSREDLRSTRHRAGVVQHAARYRPGDVELVDGMPALSMARTVCDLARFHGYRHGLVAADAALRRGVARSDFEAAVAGMHQWPYVQSVRAVVEDADPGAETPGESLARELVHEAGLGPVETQFPIAHAGGVYWCDLRVGRHLIEFNGRVKYLPAEQGGLSHGDLERQLWAERKREREMCAPGFGMSQLVWADFWGARRGQAIRRLQEADRAIVMRFGRDVPAGMAEFASRVRGDRVRAS